MSPSRPGTFNLVIPVFFLFPPLHISYVWYQHIDFPEGISLLPVCICILRVLGAHCGLSLGYSVVSLLSHEHWVSTVACLWTMTQTCRLVWGAMGHVMVPAYRMHCDLLPSGRHRYCCSARKVPEGPAPFHAVDFPAPVHRLLLLVSIWLVCGTCCYPWHWPFLTVVSVDFILCASFLDKVMPSNDGNAFREMPHQVVFFLCPNLVQYIHTSCLACVMSSEMAPWSSRCVRLVLESHS